MNLRNLFIRPKASPPPHLPPAAPPIAGHKELWLTEAATGRPTLVYKAGVSHSDNMLVLGPAGSGRSLLMGRLARQAHGDGETVVMVCLRQRQQALYHFTRRRGGTLRLITSPQQLSFNPFLLQEQMDDGFYSELALLLASLLAPPQDGPAERGRVSGLYQLLRQYYWQGAWLADRGPGFDSFYEFATADKTQDWMAKLTLKGGANLLALCLWLREAGRPFYGDGPLAYLLNARQPRVRNQLRPQNRLLYLELALSSPPLEGSSQELRCLLWLLLRAIDQQVAVGKESVAVFLDEFPLSCLGAGEVELVEHYLRTRRQHWRRLVMSWHLDPAQVFDTVNLGARVLYDNSGYLFMLPASNMDRGNNPVWSSLSKADQQQAANLQQASRQVLARGLRTREESPVCCLLMNPDELAEFEPVVDEQPAARRTG